MYTDDDNGGGRYKSGFLLHVIKNLPDKTKILYLDTEATMDNRTLQLFVKDGDKEENND